ncbi:DNA-processing protein DprA [Microbacterium gorillae]|uniref:DNA-processing protein DprA n=1 Tax=Microbacterium gorillae TaxID=1231063 RepID=UPI00059105CF|nr:DNA-processing protein DprA [Microbacterium gorillae]
MNRGEAAAERSELARARLAWSFLVEPGDGDAGALVAALGPQEALAAVRANRPPAAGTRWHEAFARWRPRLERVDLPDQADRARRCGARLLIPEDDGWPARVDDLDVHAPLCLWVRGDPEALVAATTVAIVGARASSGYGDLVTAEFAAELAAAGVVVVSGAAYGIDGAAHRAALAAGGATVAVLAGGADRVYPAGHAELLGRIVGSGAVVSELPLGSEPSRWRFLTRNRIIAALGDATVVVEAGWRSGSLNTAGHAATLGRSIGAVPGPITSPASAGCHRLLREYDATCVTTAAEVQELLGAEISPERRPAEPAGPSSPRSTTAASPPEDDGAERLENRVADALALRTPRPVEDIAVRAGVAVASTEAALGLLLLQGRARRADGGWTR